jgi:hypothetical protein
LSRCAITPNTSHRSQSRSARHILHALAQVTLIVAFNVDKILSSRMITVERREKPLDERSAKRSFTGLAEIHRQNRLRTDSCGNEPFGACARTAIFFFPRGHSSRVCLKPEPRAFRALPGCRGHRDARALAGQLLRLLAQHRRAHRRVDRAAPRDAAGRPPPSGSAARSRATAEGIALEGGFCAFRLWMRIPARKPGR